MVPRKIRFTPANGVLQRNRVVDCRGYFSGPRQRKALYRPHQVERTCRRCDLGDECGRAQLNIPCHLWRPMRMGGAERAVFWCVLLYAALATILFGVMYGINQ